MSCPEFLSLYRWRVKDLVDLVILHLLCLSESGATTQEPFAKASLHLQVLDAEDFAETVTLMLYGECSLCCSSHALQEQLVLARRLVLRQMLFHQVT